MPISKIQAYAASDGRIGTLAEVQRWELELALFPATGLQELPPDLPALQADIVNRVLSASDHIVEVLTTGPRSRPKARRQPGTTQPRQAAKMARSGSTKQPTTTTKQEVT